MCKSECVSVCMCVYVCECVCVFSINNNSKEIMYYNIKHIS